VGPIRRCTQLRGAVLRQRRGVGRVREAERRTGTEHGGLEQLGAGQGHHEDRDALRPGQEVLDKVEQAAVGGDRDQPLVADWEPLVRSVLADRAAGAAVGQISARFHNTLAGLAVGVAEGVGLSLKVPVERFYSNIARYGNTSSASMLIAAAEWSRESPRLKPGTPVVFAAFGAGFHWGAVLARAV